LRHFCAIMNQYAPAPPTYSTKRCVLSTRHVLTYTVDKVYKTRRGIQMEPYARKKPRFTTYLPVELLERMRRIAYFEPGMTIAKLCELSLEATASDFEKRAGGPYPEIPADDAIPTGRRATKAAPKATSPQKRKSTPAMLKKSQPRAIQPLPEPKKRDFWKCRKCFAHMALKSRTCFCGEPRAA